jgi:hypothetical protein
MRALLVVPWLMGIALVVGGATSDNGTMMSIGFSLAGVAVVLFLILKGTDLSKENAERRRIWKEGRPATAKILKITEIGGDDHPDVDLEIEVRADGAPATPVKVRSSISRLAIPRIQPGCEIQVRVDPTDSKKVVIDPELTPYRIE